MLCKTLIATVAIACTLSRIHALGQGTQRLDRIKDVVCVLLLSGMQKEDLDVSMLTKLEQHNVNIDEMYKGHMLQDCLPPNKSKVINITELEGHVTGSKNDSSNITPFLDTINNPKKLEQETYNAKDNVKKMEAVYDIFTQHMTTTESEANVNRHIIRFADAQPKLEGGFKIWQDVPIDKTIKMQQLTQRPTSRKKIILDDNNFRSEKENKRSISENKNSNEADTINKLLENLLLKRSNFELQPTSNRRYFDFNNKEEIKKMLQLEEKSNTNVDNEFNRGSMYIQGEQNDKNIFKNDSNITGIQHEEPNLKLPFNNDMYSALNPWKQYNLVNPYINVNENTKDNSRIPSYQYLQNLKSFTIADIKTTKKSENIFPQDIIKEIAKSVKELVLRDLQKEIGKKSTLDTTSSISATTTTTTTISTTTIMTTATTQVTTEKDFLQKASPGKANIQDSILSKFLELFEEIKSIKGNAMTIIGEDKKDIYKKKRLVMPQQNMSPPETRQVANLLPPINLHEMSGGYPVVNLPRNFEFMPQIHKFRSNRTIFIKENNKGMVPITVQTNNIEIPPLGVPLDKPQNLINQNIVVTTFKPYRIGYNKAYSAHVLERSKKVKENIPKKNHPRIAKVVHDYPDRQQQHYIDSKPEEDVIRLTLDNNRETAYNTNYYNKFMYSKYKPNRQPVKDKHSDAPRFHEKLENVEKFTIIPQDHDGYRDDCCNTKYTYSQAMVDCCNKKIASRQQMSLNNIKKAYNDIHFRNFLNSQQKVTDMLERVLAEKGKVRSVETI